MFPVCEKWLNDSVDVAPNFENCVRAERTKASGGNGTEATYCQTLEATYSSPSPYALYGHSLSAVFASYQAVIVLLLFMPNVHCQAWSDLKHFKKAWIDVLCTLS